MIRGSDERGPHMHMNAPGGGPEHTYVQYVLGEQMTLSMTDFVWLYSM